MPIYIYICMIRRLERVLLFDDYYAYHYTFPKFPTGLEGDF